MDEATAAAAEQGPLPDKWQIVAELRGLLAMCGLPMKSRTVNSLVEIVDGQPNVRVEDVMRVLDELKKVKTYSVLVHR